MSRRWGREKVIWTNEMRLEIYNLLRKGCSNISIAEQMGYSPSFIGTYLRKTDSETVKKGLDMRAAWRERVGWKTGKKKADPYKSLRAIEARGLRELGKSLTQISDENVEWMREHGYTAALKTSTERWKFREKGKRLQEDRERRAELRDEMEADIVRDNYGVLKPE